MSNEPAVTGRLIPTRIKGENWDPANKGVLAIYTGGTIGSMPKDKNDPDSPQVVVPWEEFETKTPQLAELGFRVDCWAFDKPLDSCNIGPREWRRMAETIYEYYGKYEGFVIVHGTDTMVYTASALSFMLVNLQKPVIITGAQRAHLFNVRNDALQNLTTALQIANPKASKIPVVPEVCIFFRDKLLRGNRSRKFDASGYAAYDSPNFKPLGIAGDKIHIDDKLILPVPSDKAFYIRRAMETSVIAFDVFPGIQDSDFASRLLKDSKLKGVILRSYGSGNIPTDPKFLHAFEEATKREVVIQNVSQCAYGMVELGIYETSAMLLDLGMASGVDITPEAALTKLMVALGDEDMASFEDKRNFMQESRAGEQSISIYVARLRNAGDKSALMDAEHACYRLAPQDPLPGQWGTADIEVAALRLYRAQVSNVGDDQPVQIELYAKVGTRMAHTA